MDKDVSSMEGKIFSGHVYNIKEKVLMLRTVTLGFEGLTAASSSHKMWSFVIREIPFIGDSLWSATTISPPSPETMQHMINLKDHVEKMDPSILREDDNTTNICWLKRPK